ncbi:hypothetical protein GPLA_2192 [Paraglaciecola polaris LMG 21857]|uniref:Uncharacterized protein n=1 Tax=Paraglaciecola polaris LMG 21857 TaxID=1129793 RepID=K6ZS15_9ALTE|nr:hypothetical protein GPLA_2192 [Paraglaciecola polaris LMG 21857]
MWGIVDNWLFLTLRSDLRCAYLWPTATYALRARLFAAFTLWPAATMRYAYRHP